MTASDELHRRVAAGLAQGLAYGVVLMEPDFTVAWVSPGAVALVGFSSEALVGRSGFELIHPDDVGAAARLVLAEQEDPHPFGSDPASLATNQVRLRAADGSWRMFEVAANNQCTNPAVGGFVLVLRDITEGGMQAEVLRRLAVGSPLPDVLQAVAELLAWQVRGAGVRISASNGMGALVRAGTPSVPATPPSLVVTVPATRFPATLSVWLPHTDVATHWAQVLVERAGELIRLALTRDSGEAELRRAARTDPLTTAGNHAGLMAHLAEVAGSGWGGTHAVIYLDLDDFKQVNDTAGHAAGDAVLVEVAQRLRRCVRPTDHVARPGGDEFVIVCSGLSSAAVGRTVAERVLRSLDEPHVLATGEHVVCRATVGLATTGDPTDVPRLLTVADRALLAAKRAGKHRVEHAVPGGGSSDDGGGCPVGQ